MSSQTKVSPGQTGVVFAPGAAPRQSGGREGALRAHRNTAPTEGGVRLMRIDLRIGGNAGLTAGRLEGYGHVAA
jgi:hypothetical protein